MKEGILLTARLKRIYCWEGPVRPIKGNDLDNPKLQDIDEVSGEAQELGHPLAKRQCVIGRRTLSSPGKCCPSRAVVPQRQSLLLCESESTSGLAMEDVLRSEGLDRIFASLATLFLGAKPSCHLAPYLRLNRVVDRIVVLNQGVVEDQGHTPQRS